MSLVHKNDILGEGVIYNTRSVLYYPPEEGTSGNQESLTRAISLELPWPPSANTIWRKVGTRVLLSAKARAFRAAVASCVASARARDKLPMTPLSGGIAVTLALRPPDRKRRDIDNFTKATLDAMTRAGVWNDDSQLQCLAQTWEEPVKGGCVVVKIEAASTLKSKSEHSKIRLEG